MPSKSEIAKKLLKKLDDIDKKHESGKITKRQHDSQSKTAINSALRRVK